MFGIVTKSLDGISNFFKKHEPEQDIEFSRIDSDTDYDRESELKRNTEAIRLKFADKDDVPFFEEDNLTVDEQERFKDFLEELGED